MKKQIFFKKNQENGAYLEYSNHVNYHGSDSMEKKCFYEKSASMEVLKRIVDASRHPRSERHSCLMFLNHNWKYYNLVTLIITIMKRKTKSIERKTKSIGTACEIVMHVEDNGLLSCIFF